MGRTDEAAERNLQVRGPFRGIGGSSFIQNPLQFLLVTVQMSSNLMTQASQSYVRGEDSSLDLTDPALLAYRSR
jgi:hypothetical protein